MRNRTEKIMFPSENIYLEGLLTHSELSKGVVISHPHPLYGGNMDNQVVRLLAQAFENLGWSTLIFNFRGVGRSQGDFDQGQGEQDDVLAASSYLKGLGLQEIILAGYSFGAWINARAALQEPAIENSILVAPPLAMMDFSFLELDTKTKLIIVGDQDPFCPVAAVKQMTQVMKRPPSLKIISGADHFFSSGSEELIAAIFKELEIVL
jgi:alpha/beta superfamily hydrolase